MILVIHCHIGNITIAPAMYQLYCFKEILKWTEANNKIPNEHNGFRKKSTIGHLSSLTNIIGYRMKNKMSTFAALICRF